MAKIADAHLSIPSKDTARIQEGHILCGHMLCDWVELSSCERIRPQTEKAQLTLAGCHSEVNSKETRSRRIAARSRSRPLRRRGTI